MNWVVTTEVFHNIYCWNILQLLTTDVKYDWQSGMIKAGKAHLFWWESFNYFNGTLKEIPVTADSRDSGKNWWIYYHF